MEEWKNGMGIKRRIIPRLELKKTSSGAGVPLCHTSPRDGGWMRILVRGPGRGRGRGGEEERARWAVALCRGREDQERLRLCGV